MLRLWGRISVNQLPYYDALYDRLKGKNESDAVPPKDPEHGPIRHLGALKSLISD